MHNNFLLSFQGNVVYLSLEQSCKQPICGKSDFCPAVSSLFFHSTKTWTGGKTLTEGLIYSISQTQRYKCAATHHKRATEKRQQVAAYWQKNQHAVEVEYSCWSSGPGQCRLKQIVLHALSILLLCLSLFYYMKT